VAQKEMASRGWTVTEGLPTSFDIVRTQAAAKK
jgi:hypothetical protein